MSLLFDIESNILDEFLDLYKLNKDNNDEILKKCIDIIKAKTINDLYTHLENLLDVHIGQYIKLVYAPNSQKYIEYYDSLDISGYLVYKNEKLNDALILHIDSDGKHILQSYIRYGCSYFGDSAGYSIFISNKNNL
jgi:hypothetical protein